MQFDEFEVFARDVSVEDLMAVLVDQFGRRVADQTAKQAVLVAQGRAPKPKVVWPLFP